MTNFSLEGLTFTPPAEFIHEEVVSSWRVQNNPGLKDPRLMQAQAQIRPNLTVTRVHVDEPDLEGIAARTCDDLMRRIEGVQGVKASAIKFADGADGVLVEYAFPVMQFTVVQMQAMRVDGNTLTTLVLCTEASRLTDPVHAQYLDSLKSAAVKG